MKYKLYMKNLEHTHSMTLFGITFSLEQWKTQTELEARALLHVYFIFKLKRVKYVFVQH